MLRRRTRRKRWLGEDAIEMGSKVGDKVAACDDSLERTVGALWRHGNVLLFGGACQLILERKGRRGSHAVRRQGGQLQCHDPHARSRKHRFLAMWAGQASGALLPDCTTVSLSSNSAHGFARPA